MPRPSSRPSNARQKSRSSTGIPKTSKQTPTFKLPEDDDDDFRPRSRKKRSKEQTKERDAKTREHFEEQLNEMADDLIEAIDEDNPNAAKKYVSVFAKDFKKLREQLSPDNTDLRVDQTSAAFYRASLAMLVDMLPIAEKAYRQSAKESAAYALAAIINQIRDLQNDVKLSEDIEGRLIIIKQLIHGSFIRIADYLLREKYSLHQQIDSLTTDGRLRKAFRKELDGTVLNFAKGLQEYQNLLTTQISMYLIGDPNYLNPQASSDEDTHTKKRKAKPKRKAK